MRMNSCKMLLRRLWLSGKYYEEKVLQNPGGRCYEDKYLHDAGEKTMGMK